jgi:hypothetical protein
MTERIGLEVNTLTIRIAMRLQRRGGWKLIMTPEGTAAPTPKPRRDEAPVKALLRAHAGDRESRVAARNRSPISPNWRGRLLSSSGLGNIRPLRNPPTMRPPRARGGYSNEKHRRHA